MSKILVSLLTLFLVACKTKEEKIVTNIQFPEISPEHQILEKEKFTSWSEIFNEPTIKKLIDSALIKNSDIDIAISNIMLEQANLEMQSSGSLPRFGLGINNKKNQNTKEIELATRVKVAGSSSINLNVSYELDLWNKLASATRAQKSLLKSAESTKENIKITIASSVAINYFDLVKLRNHKNILEKMLANQEELFRLSKVKYNAGAINKIELDLSEVELSNLKIKLSELDKNIIIKQNALRVLTGQEPEDYLEEIETIEDIEKFNVIPIKIPMISSHIILERPDIKAAEEALIAANISSDIAKKYYLPNITLNGLIGLASIKIEDIFSNNSKIWQIGGDLTSPLFDFGKSKSNYKLKQANAKKALGLYEKAIKSAFFEIRDALITQETCDKNYIATEKKFSNWQNISKLNNIKYKEGYISKVELLQEDQKFLQNKIDLVNAKNAQIGSVLTLAKTMGKMF